MTGDLRTTLLDLIGTGIAAHPRSLQRTVGPSDIANQCDVCLLRALDGSKGQRPGDDGWLPTIGTAVHSWLEDVVDRHGGPGWITEQRVHVGWLRSPIGPPVAVQGTLDLYSAAFASIIDHKVVGDSTLKLARGKKSHEPGGKQRNYAVQVQQYGYGLAQLGLPVRQVTINYLPRNGHLSSAVLYEEPLDERVTLDALDRAARLLTILRSTGLDTAVSNVEADPHCYQCSTTGPRTGSALAGAVLAAPATKYPADLSSAVL